MMNISKIFVLVIIRNNKASSYLYTVVYQWEELSVWCASQSNRCILFFIQNKQAYKFLKYILLLLDTYINKLRN